MPYAIMRINKCKAGAVGRLAKHHEREKKEYKSNPDIDILPALQRTFISRDRLKVIKALLMQGFRKSDAR